MTKVALQNTINYLSLNTLLAQGCKKGGKDKIISFQKVFIDLSY